ncbi:MAG: hypothetical protein IT221_13895 [Fluviicola sp.]|nr:hypothetical protein [Fluviicola sp.]
MEDLLDNSPSKNDNYPAPLPNATGALVLGIISIVTCWLYAIPGLVCGIIALSLHAKDKKIYQTNPAKYEQSFKTSKAGQVCAIVGLSLSGLMFVYFLVILVFLAGAVGSFGRF